MLSGGIQWGERTNQRQCVYVMGDVIRYYKQQSLSLSLSIYVYIYIYYNQQYVFGLVPSNYLKMGCPNAYFDG